MKRLILGGVLLACALATPAVGRQLPPVPQHLHSWIDDPNVFVYNTYGPNFSISGWSFDCRTGQQPPFLAVLHGNFDANPPVYQWITDYTVRRGTHRPDVQAAFAGACPMSADVGFTIYPETVLTSGRHTFTVFWADSQTGGLAQSTTVWVLVP